MCTVLHVHGVVCTRCCMYTVLYVHDVVCTQSCMYTVLYEKVLYENVLYVYGATCAQFITF
jgi:hypothetical protein